MATSTPRDYTPGAGMPGDRLAQLAARRAFVGLKRLFIDAAARVDDGDAPWLRAQVRAAEEPVDLWLLRGPLLQALAAGDPPCRLLRGQLRQALARTFRIDEPSTTFAHL